MIGRLTAVYHQRGYAFVKTTAGFDYFIPAGSCYSPFSSLHEGQLVAFDEDLTGPKPQAHNVMILKPEDIAAYTT
jgi:cold shock CspA family protein